MLNRLRQLLGAAPDRTDQPDRLQVASCALLLEMAYADHHLDPREEALTLELLQRRFALDSEALTLLMKEARQARRESSDLFQFAREINAAFKLDEKLELMETLWRIVYVDGILDKYEDALARQLATLLHISPRQAIDLKLKVLNEVRSQS